MVNIEADSSGGTRCLESGEGVYRNTWVLLGTQQVTQLQHADAEEGLRGWAGIWATFPKEQKKWPNKFGTFTQRAAQ